jgi:hypothetical protein
MSGTHWGIVSGGSRQGAGRGEEDGALRMAGSQQDAHAPGKDSSLPIPAFGGIGEFMDGALLFLALLVFLFEFGFPRADDLPQSGVFFNTHDVADLVAFAPANPSLTAKPRIAPDNEAGSGKGLPQAFDQEFDDRRRVFGAINPAIRGLRWTDPLGGKFPG